jgi:putative membrane protein
MKTWKFIGLMMIASCTFQACDKDDIDKGDEIEFVSKAASSNLFEIESGRLAVNNGVSVQVKAYGNHMITDHTMATAELNTVASQNGIAVPTSMNADHQTMYNTLAAKSGVDFDRTYAQMMVDSHQRTLALFEEAAEDLDVPAIKAFAASKLDVLRHHLEEAQTLRTSVQ